MSLNLHKRAPVFRPRPPRLARFPLGPLTITDRGTFQTAAGGSITMSTTSSSFSVAAGALLVLGVTVDARNDHVGGSNDLTATITDTIGDSGGGSWTKRAECTRGVVAQNQYGEHVWLYTRVIGTSPGTGKTVTAALDFNGTTTSGDGWVAGHLWEVSGQATSPIGLSSSPSPATSTSTFNTDLGAAPASTSAVFGVIHDDNQTGSNFITQPTSWTESDEQDPAFGVASEWAYKNGSSVQSPQWSGFTNSAGVRILGAALEIKAGPPLPPPPPATTNREPIFRHKPPGLWVPHAARRVR